MHLALSLLLALLSIHACAGRPYFFPYLGIEELRHDGSNKGSVFHEMNGGYLKLDYEHELHDGVLNIDKDKQVQRVECKGDYVTITVAEYDSELWSTAKVLAGGREWGCVNEFNKPNVLLKIILSVAVVDQHTLLLETKEASYTHAFKTLKMDFSTNLFEPSPPTPPSTAVGNHRQERNWFSNFFTNIWNEVKTIANDVVHAVQDAWTVIEVLADGSYEGSFNRTLAHFSFSNNSEWQNSVITCSDCGMNAQLAVVFQIQIQDYTLDTLLLALEGSANAQIEGQLSGSDSWSNSESKSVGTFHIATIYLDIGVPIVLSITVPVSVGYTAKVTVGASMDAYVTLDGSFEFGIQYNNQTDEFQYINQHSWTHNGNIGSIGSAEVNADVTLYIMPTFVVEVDRIGGPYVALKPFVELSAGYSSNATQTCTNNSFHAAFNWGLFVSIGAEIDIWLIGDKKFGPQTLYSMKLPIAAGCVSLNGTDGLSFSPGPPIPSDVWYSGNMTPTCGNFSTLQIGVQIVESTDNETYAVFAYYGSSAETYSYCTAQALYSVDLNSHTFTANPVTNSSSGYAVGYVWCQQPYNGTFFVPSTTGKFSQDYSTIILSSDDHCITAQLIR